MKIHNIQITGSSGLAGNQSITGSLTVTGNIIAQQYVVSSSVTHLTESFASGSHVFGNSSDDTHQFTGSVLMSGNVGIGTTSPSQKLDVNGAIKTLGNYFEVNNTPFSTNGTITYHDTVGLVLKGATGYVFDFAIYSTGSTGSPLLVNPTGTTNMVFPTGNVGIGGSPTAMGAYKILEVQNATGGIIRYTNTSAQGGYIAGNSGGLSYDTLGAFPHIFYTNGTSRMTIANDGNLGIGTSTPDFISSGDRVLTVQGSSTRATLNLQNSSTGTSGVAGSIRGYNGSTGLSFIDMIADGATNSGAFIFYTNNAGTIGERFRISAFGTVYVNGSTNPLPDNATPQFGILAGAGTDAVNIKHTQNGNNTFNLWQTGTTSCNMIAFYKGDTQINRGLITVTTSGTTYNSVSDYRLKENIVPLENGLDRVLQLKPSKFNWIETGSETEGFIAHELQEYFPDAVTGEKDAMYQSTGNIKPQSVDYGRITPLLVKAIQEQQELIQSLQSRLDTLENV